MAELEVDKGRCYYNYVCYYTIYIYNVYWRYINTFNTALYKYTYAGAMLIV